MTLTTKQKQHKALCAICKHKECKEIEYKYLDGTSPYQIELDYPGVSHVSVYAHAKIFKLDKKRDNTTLTKVRLLLDRANIGKVKITEAMVPKLLELEAKLSGELVERRENKNKNETVTKHDISKSVEKRVDRLIDSIPGARKIVNKQNKK